MATHNISTQAVTWPNPTQYVDSTISGGSAGDTYVLLAGRHRMQSVLQLRAGDTLRFADGAIMDGSEDFPTTGWTDNGDGTWYKQPPSPLNAIAANTACRSGYDCRRIEWIIIDGDPKAFLT